MSGRTLSARFTSSCALYPLLTQLRRLLAVLILPLELKESSSNFLGSKHSSHTSASNSGAGSRSTTPTPGNPRPDERAVETASGSGVPPVARSGMLKIRVTAGKGFQLPQGGESCIRLINQVCGCDNGLEGHNMPVMWSCWRPTS